MAYTTRSGRRTNKVNYSDTYNSRRSRSVTPQQIIQEDTNQDNDTFNDDIDNSQSDQESIAQEPPKKKQKTSNTTSTSTSTPSSTTNNRKKRRRRSVRKKKAPITSNDDDKKDKENEDPMDIDDEDGDDIMDLTEIDANNNHNKNKNRNKSKKSKKSNDKNKSNDSKNSSTLPPNIEIEMDDIPTLDDLPSMAYIEGLELDEPSPTKKKRTKKKSKAKSKPKSRKTKVRKGRKSSSKQELSSDEDSSDSDSDNDSDSSLSDSSSSDDLEILSAPKPKPKKKKRVLPSLKPKKKATPKKVKKTKASPEKRRARKRTCTQKVRDRIARARTQRLFMINAKVISDHEREYAVLGSTGNVYTITIGTLNECTCPDFAKGNLCKHVMFIMLKVLRVSHNSEYVYQKALLSTELEEIFAAAPQTLFGVMANAEVRRQYNKAMGDDDDETAGDIEAGEVKRKPLEGDCPVCMDDIDEKEATTWCRGQCGNNVHVQCFKEWKKSALRAGQDVVCMYCRAPWIDGPKDKVAGQKKGKKGSSSFNEGYMNLASEQGMSTTRDTSTYYQSGWRGYGRRARGYGWRSRWY